MAARNWEMTPYVNAQGPPDNAGITQFLDYPRYSSGYAAQFNTIAFMPETHMLKPFKDRVLSTYAIMDVMIRFMDSDHAALAEARKKAMEITRDREEFVLNYSLVKEKFKKYQFHGLRC